MVPPDPLLDGERTGEGRGKEGERKGKGKRRGREREREKKGKGRGKEGKGKGWGRTGRLGTPPPPAGPPGLLSSISAVVFSPCAAKESLHRDGDWLAKYASLIPVLIFTPLLPICRDLPADVQSQPRREAAGPAPCQRPHVPKVPPRGSRMDLGSTRLPARREVGVGGLAGACCGEGCRHTAGDGGGVPM